MYSMSLRNRDAMVMPARLMVEHEATADHLLQPLRSDDGQLFHNLVREGLPTTHPKSSHPLQVLHRL
jgi:hypothetical protein